MKLNENFALRQVADFWVVLPLGEKTLEFSGMINLNDTGAMLWQILEAGAEKEDLVKALTKEYDVSEQQALTDIEEFIDKLTLAGCLQA